MLTHLIDAEDVIGEFPGSSRLTAIGNFCRISMMLVANARMVDLRAKHF